MKYTTQLEKTKIANKLFREISAQEIPAKSTVYIKIEISKGEVKEIEFKKENPYG